MDAQLATLVDLAGGVAHSSSEARAMVEGISRSSFGLSDMAGFTGEALRRMSAALGGIGEQTALVRTAAGANAAEAGSLSKLASRFKL